MLSYPDISSLTSAEPGEDGVVVMAGDDTAFMAGANDLDDIAVMAGDNRPDKGVDGCLSAAKDIVGCCGDDRCDFRKEAFLNSFTVSVKFFMMLGKPRNDKYNKSEDL